MPMPSSACFATIPTRASSGLTPGSSAPSACARCSARTRSSGPIWHFAPTTPRAESSPRSGARCSWSSPIASCWARTPSCRSAGTSSRSTPPGRASGWPNCPPTWPSASRGGTARPSSERPRSAPDRARAQAERPREVMLPGAATRYSSLRRAAGRGAAVALGAVVGLAAAAPAPAAPACLPPPGFHPLGRIESRDVAIVYRVEPAIQVGRHFAVEAMVCAEAPAEVSGLRVDADMPEHRHGMNYRATVSGRGDSLYVAEGLLFHMPGRWRLLFDVERAGRTEHLEAEISLE